MKKNAPKKGKRAAGGKRKSAARPAANARAKKKARANASAGKRSVRSKAPKPIGTVTHYYNHINVALVKFAVKVKAGTALWFKGATTDFKDTPKSMQFDHKPIASAPAKKLIGVKVKKRVREGDLVYKA